MVSPKVSGNLPVVGSVLGGRVWVCHLHFSGFALLYQFSNSVRKLLTPLERSRGTQAALAWEAPGANGGSQGPLGLYPGCK